MMNRGTPDVDAVVTTRELLNLIHHYSINIPEMDPEYLDHPLYEASSSGMMFDTPGGRAIATIKALFFRVAGKEFTQPLNFKTRSKGIKTASVKISNRLTINIAVVEGLGETRKFFDSILPNENFHFVEILACPGGCIMGGGQPKPTGPKIKDKREKALLVLLNKTNNSYPHHNNSLKEFYEVANNTNNLLHTQKEKNQCR